MNEIHASATSQPRAGAPRALWSRLSPGAIAAVGLALLLWVAACSGGLPRSDGPMIDESTPVATTRGTGASAPDEGEDPKGPADIVLQASEGNVAFPHRQHQEDFACESCHHTRKGEERPTSCHDCHGADPTLIGTETAFHTWCLSCHEQQAGPTACEHCHVR